jgi:uncharacterized alpha-E superfamily protein
MLSRVADSIYWVGRYLERAENVARFMDVNLHVMLDSGSANPWWPLVVSTGDQDAFTPRYGEATRENVIRFLTFDESNPNSIVSSLKVARENARSVREIITQEMWENLNRFYWTVNADAAAEKALRNPHEFLLEIKVASQLFVGATDATMSRNEAWHFLRLGTLIERADKSTRVLDMKSHLLRSEARDVEVHWSAVLHSASALEMYRRRHGLIQPEHVVRFILLDHEFPRAVHFCLLRASESLHAITGTSPGMFTNAAEQRLGQLRSELAYTRVEDILGRGLHEYLDALQVDLNRIGEAFHEAFFACRAGEDTTVQECAMSAQ